MKRKYDNPKNIRIGEYVYWSDGNSDTRFPYRVVAVKEDHITVELNKNKIDDFMINYGWFNPNIGNGRYWNVILWTRAKGKNKVCMSLE